MRSLYRWVNLVPVLAVADQYTHEEIIQIKQVIKQEAREVGIKFFNFGEFCDDLGKCPPFALFSAININRVRREEE